MMKKLALTLALVLAALLALSACSAGDSEGSGLHNSIRADSAGGAPYPSPATDYADYAVSPGGGLDDGGWMGEMDAVENGAPSAGDNLSVTDPGRKLIRRAHLEFETTDFDAATAAVEQLCTQYDGYIQGSNVSGSSIVYGRPQMRSANYTLRIPAAQYGAFLNSADSVGNRINKTLSSDDITDSYYDIESRLQILTMRRDRLMKLLEESESAENIVVFERELSDTLYEIERMTGQLNTYDRLVDYTTVNLLLQEVVVYTETEPIVIPPETVWERVSAAFVNSAKAIGEFFTNLFVFLIGNVLYLLLIGAVVAAVLIPVTRHNKKQRQLFEAKIKERQRQAAEQEAEKTDEQGQP